MAERQLRAAIYARVSTADQNVEPQVAELRFYVHRRGWMAAGEYVEVGSGADSSRVQFRRLCQDARLHEFDVVVVYDLSRLGRNQEQLLKTLFEWKNLGIGFCAMREEYIDTTSPFGVAIYSMIAALRQTEREVQVEKIRLGMAAAKSGGKAIGRPKKRLDEKKIRADYERLESVRRVARLHGCSRSTIREILAGTRGKHLAE